MKAISIISRIFAFPFFVGFSLIAVIRIWVTWIWFFIRYGGEAIAYSEKIRPRTILDVYVKVAQKVKENDKVLPTVHERTEGE